MKAAKLALIFLHVLCGSCAKGQRPPEFTVASSPQTPVSGETLRLAAYTDRAEQYLWLKDGTAVNGINTSPLLVIKNVNRNDSGMYQCNATNAYGSTLSDVFNVQVQYFAQWQQPATPTIVTASIGTTATLVPPRIDSYPQVTYAWQEIVNLAPSPITQPYYFVQSSGQILIPDVAPGDDGRQFQVRFYDFDGAPIIVRYTLRVTGSSTRGPFSLSLPLPNTTVAVQGRSATMECYANARDGVNIQWYVWPPSGSAKQPVSSYIPQRNTMEYSNSRLTVTNLSPSDSGLYSCEATLTTANGPTVIMSYTTLAVQVPPTIVSAPSPDNSPPAGALVVLPCGVSGIPKPTVVWFKDASPVSSLSKMIISSNGTLTIPGFNQADSGNYQCFAANAAGRVSVAAFVNFLSAPVFRTQMPPNVMAVEGRDVSLLCSAIGNPMPTIVWFKDAQLLTNTVKYVIQPGLLKILSMALNDAGTYQCTASNSAGSGNVQTTVVVYSRTVIVNSSANVIEVPKTSSVRLWCLVRSDPRIVPTILWYRASDPNPLASDSLWVLENNNQTLFLPQVVQQRNGGDYLCSATSIAEGDYRSFMVIVIEVPYPPQAVAVRLSTSQNRTVRLTWQTPYDGNKPIRYYRLMQTESGSTVWTVAVSHIPFPSNSWDVTGLAPSKTYTFKLFAVNDVGDGQESAISDAVTIPAEPPGSPPLSVTILQSTSTSFAITFMSPDAKDWNGALVGYYIDYKIPGGTWERKTYLSTTYGQQAYALAGLISYQEYFIRLAAFNAQGSGPYTGEYKVKTLDGVPFQPPVITSCVAQSSTSVQLTWMPPDPTSVNGDIKGYDLNVSLVDRVGGSNVKTERVSSTVLQKVFIGLDRFTTYAFTVVLFTNGGRSPVSLPASVTTMQDIPGPVSSLTLQSKTHRSIVVSWSAPASPNGILTAYYLSCVGPSGELVSSTSLSNSTLSASCENLTSSTAYAVNVATATIIGPGPVSAVQVQTLPPPELPGIVYSLSIDSVGSRSVSVRFTPGYDGKAVITAYIVQALVAGSSSWSNIWVNNGSANSFVVERLQPYTRYVVRIVAQNIAGQSNASQSSSPFMTQQDTPAHAPSNITVRPQDATTLIIAWTPLLPSEWNGPSEAYIISYWRSSASRATASARNITNPLSRAFVLDGLTAWTEYLIQVAASNQLFLSDYSPAVNCSTLESAPVAAPLSVTAVAVNSTAASVSWDSVPTRSANGAITSYSLWYSRIPSSTLPTVVEVSAAQSPGQYYITGLTPCAAYSVRVAASTRAGQGPYSDPPPPVTMLPDTLPPPTNVYCPAVTESSISVAWVPPSTSCSISGHVVSYWLSEDDVSSAQDRFYPLDIKQVSISGLTAAKLYSIKIAARNSEASGRATIISVMTTTTRSLPLAPTSLTAASLTPRTAALSWSAVAYPAAPVRNYTVYVKSQKVPSWTAWGEPVLAPASECIVSALSPYTDYEVRVTASNDIGQSEPSQSVSLKTPSGAPASAPRNLQVIPVTANALTVQWDGLPSDEWNGLPVSYRVLYNTYAETVSNASVHIVPYPELSTTLSGLRSGVVYEIRVAVGNEVANGPYSLPVAVFVGVAVPSAMPAGVQAFSFGPTSIMVQWQGLTADQQNGDLLGYKIYYSKQSSAVTRTVRSAFFSPTYDVVSPEQHQHLIVGLQEFASYAVAVAAFNIAGEGPYSTSTYVTTQTDVPGPPGLITSDSITLSIANITWSPPERSNGVITGYRLSHSLQTAGKVSSIQPRVDQVLVSGTSYLLRSLAENVTYAILVAAQTSAGWGNATSVTLSTSSPPGSPAMPFNVRYLLQTTSVTVNWMVNDNGLSPAIGYVIEALPKNGAAEDWQLVAHQWSTSSEATISRGLIADSQGFERFRVSLFNSYGVSPAALAQEADAPIFKQWWFLVMVALIALVVIVSIVAALCCECYRRRAKKAKLTYQNEVFNSTVDEALGHLEMRQSIRRSSQRSLPTRQPMPSGHLDLGLISAPGIGSNSMYSDEPPPHYDEDEDERSSSVTEKPSLTDDEDDEYDDAKKASSASDNEEVDGQGRSRGRQPSYNHFQYAGHYATPSVRKSWRNRQKLDARNVYSYTDSEADSYYDDRGRRQPGSAYQSQPVGSVPSATRVNLSDANVPGSRAPLPGFSSFV